MRSMPLNYHSENPKRHPKSVRLKSICESVTMFVTVVLLCTGVASAYVHMNIPNISTTDNNDPKLYTDSMHHTHVIKPFKVPSLDENLKTITHHLFKDKLVRLAVISPEDPMNEFSLRKILPMIELASNHVTDPQNGYLPGWSIEVDYRDSNCSSIEGPLAAFEFYINDKAGGLMFLFYFRRRCAFDLVLYKFIINLDLFDKNFINAEVFRRSCIKILNLGFIKVILKA